MNEAEKQKTIIELKDFHKKLKSYGRLLDPDRQLSEAQKRYRDSLREILQRKIGNHKDIITQLTGKQFYKQLGTTGEVWAEGLRTSGYLPSKRLALTMCIDVTNEAIGKLESMPLTKSELEEVGVTQILKDTGEVPNSLFDKMQFHPRVIQVSESLFKTCNYASAILEAFKAIDNFVKEKTALTLNGQALMSKAFDENTPIIKLNDLLTQSDRDEQEGFKFLFKGATIGIRNPKAHDNVIQTDPYKTLEYLGLASLLMRRIEEGNIVKLSIMKEQIS